MKYIKRFVVGVLLLFLVTVIVSVETDFFANIENYMPKLTQKCPVIVKIADGIEDMTEDIPSFSQIIESIKGKSLPNDPNDFVKGSYNSKSPMLSFYQKESIGITVNSGSELSVFGMTNAKDKSNILIVLTDKNGNELKRESVSKTVSSNEFQKKIKIPNTKTGIVNVNIYAGKKTYGEFSSWAIDYISLEKTEEGWQIKKAPVAEHNKAMYEEGKSLSAGLKKTASINPDDSEIKAIAEQLTKGMEDDYEKITAFHDWVCNYLYYNIDYIENGKIAPYIDTEVIDERNVVCLGYSNLFASLCRSAGIPCYVVSGYALGIDTEDTAWNDTNYQTTTANHAWNEAYVNDRWVIVDTTWDSFNRFENGKRVKGERSSYLYFDANPEFFSANHKIIEYLTD